MAGCATNSISKASKDTGLLAGTARVDITPPDGVPMMGYGARKDVSQGVHDPLMARALVLKNGNESLAIVSVDLVFFYQPRVVEEAKKRWNLNHVVICGSHTHSGPRIQGDWVGETEEKIINAIGEASKSLFPARIGVARAEIEPLAHNRRLVQPDGTVKMIWDNPKRIPTSPTDPRAGVIRVDDATGKTRAVLVHLACHAVVLGAQNLLISADYPGAMAAYVEREMGPDCNAMFLQGAEGDIDPYDMNLGGDHGFQVVERTGVAIGKAAVAMAKQIQPLPQGQASLKVRHASIAAAQVADPEKKDNLGVMTLVIGNKAALAFISGEPFVQHQLDLDAKSPLNPTFLVSCACSAPDTIYWKYIPSEEARKTGGYGAGSDSMDWYETSTGSRITDTAAELIKESVAK